MFQFIESIRVENKKVFLLDLHQQRIYQTFAHFGRRCNWSLNQFVHCLISNDETYKLRIIYDLEQNFTFQIIPYTFSKIESFELVENNDISYEFKYLDRNLLEQMKKESSSQEIIIVKNGNITDTSFSNLLFLKDKVWYTPKIYLLNGVQRQNLLLQNKIKESEITIENLNDFSHFQIINAMNGLNSSFIYPIDRIVNLSA